MSLLRFWLSGQRSLKPMTSMRAQTARALAADLPSGSRFHGTRSAWPSMKNTRTSQMIKRRRVRDAPVTSALRLADLAANVRKRK
jgi:hypothetical protein